MARVNHKGFKMVEPDEDDLETKIIRHRKDVFYRTLWTLVIAAVIVVALLLWNALRTFESYEVRQSVERTDSAALNFENFLGKIVKYSNDGISYMDCENELIWNQSFEMGNPQVEICENYLTVYDCGGVDLYIMDDLTVKKHITTTLPIMKACVASQGTVAVLMKEGTVSYVQLFDQKGKELAKGEFYGSQGGFPIDIAFSYDAQKLAVDMVDVSDGNVKTTITFYNFGSVGQNEINNKVGTYSFSDLLVPEIAFVSSDRMIAFGDRETIIFTGAQKPELSKEIFYEGELESVFYNSGKFGIVQDNYDEAGTHQVRVFDMRGNELMSRPTNMLYTDIEFLDNGMICIRNKNSCEIMSSHGIKKFEHTFDQELYKILSADYSAEYVFVLDGMTEEVHLR